MNYGQQPQTAVSCPQDNFISGFPRQFGLHMEGHLPNEQVTVISPARILSQIYGGELHNYSSAIDVILERKIAPFQGFFC